jgi:hypothetical protein
MPIPNVSNSWVLQGHSGLIAAPVTFSCFKGGDWYLVVGTCYSCCGNGTIWEWFVQCGALAGLSASASAFVLNPSFSQQTTSELPKPSLRQPLQLLSVYHEYRRAHRFSKLHRQQVSSSLHKHRYSPRQPQLPSNTTAKEDQVTPFSS